MAPGDDGDDEHERVPEHCQLDRQQLRGVQHHAAADEDADAQPDRPSDDRTTTGRDQDAVEK